MVGGGGGLYSTPPASTSTASTSTSTSTATTTNAADDEEDDPRTFSWKKVLGERNKAKGSHEGSLANTPDGEKIHTTSSSTEDESIPPPPSPTLEATIIAEKPNTAAMQIERLLDLQRYPVGCCAHTSALDRITQKNTTEEEESWSMAMLNAMVSPDITSSTAFRLVDRWQLETVNNNNDDGDSSSRTSHDATTTFTLTVKSMIPFRVILHILRQWRNETRHSSGDGSSHNNNNNVDAVEQVLLSPEQVWGKLESYQTSGMLAHADEDNDRIPSLLLSAFRSPMVEDTTATEEDALTQPRRAESLHEAMHCQGRPASTYQLLLVWLEHYFRWSDNDTAEDRNNSKRARLQIQRLLDAQQQPTGDDHGLLHPRWTAVQLALAVREKDSASAAQYAEQILAQLAMTGDTNAFPDASSSFLLYGWIVTAVAQAGRVERAFEIWMHWMLEQPTMPIGTMRDVSADGKHALELDDDDLIRPNPVAAILAGYKMRMDKQPDVALQQLEMFWREMDDLAANNRHLENTVRPNLECYQVRVAAYSLVHKPESAEQLVRQYMSKFHGDDTSSLTDVEQDAIVGLWNGVLEAYVEKGGPSARRNCARLVSMLRRDKYSNGGRLAPTVDTYNSYLRCVCAVPHSAPLQLAESGEKLLRQIGDLADSATYFTAIQAWVNAEMPQSADKLLQEMVENSSLAPTTEHFLLVMNAFANRVRLKECRESLHKIRELVDLLETSNHAQGVEPAKSMAAFNVYVDALSHCKDRETPDLAENVLYMALEDTALQPDPVLCANILASWMRSPRLDAPQRATALFQQLKESHTTEEPVLNAHAYTTLMKIYSQHQLPGRAKLLFREMKRSEDARLRPTIDTYMVLLEAFGSAGRVEDATSHLNDLIHEHQKGSLVGATNNNVLFTPVFNSVIRAWMNSDAANAADKIAETLSTMSELATSGNLNARPDRLSYAMGIHTISLQEQVTDADVDRAWTWYQALLERLYRTGDKHFRPDLYLFSNIMEVFVVSGKADQLSTVLGDMRRLMHPKSWYDKEAVRLLPKIKEQLSRVQDSEAKQRLLDDFYAVGRRNRRDFDDICYSGVLTTYVRSLLE